MSNFDNYKFRCSSLGHLMTLPKSKKAREAGELSATTQEYLLGVYIEQVYGRGEDIGNKYTEKGNLTEEDSLTLMQGHYRQQEDYKSVLLLKNKERFENNYFTGEPDLILPDRIADAKSSWNIWTFFKAVQETAAGKGNKMYYWQLQGYMDLVDRDRADLCYCLNNTPEYMISDEFSRQVYRKGIEDGSEEMMELEEQIRKNMEFDDIPAERRIHAFTFDRDEEGLDILKKQVERARDYLNSLDL